jgi:hypothetical protein
MGRVGTYRIRVIGELDAFWSERLGEMTVTVEQYENHKLTTLHGRLIDQETLQTVLETLYDLSLPLVSVERLEQ